MCGIVGYIDFRDQHVESSCYILEMLRLQKHRGPDDSGIVAFNTANRVIQEMDTRQPMCPDSAMNGVFGFNRLSILDLSANGHQPMLGAGGKVVLMMNGEVYNAFDYKDSMTNKGYSFKSTTDTEVILNLYLEYGFDAMIRMLNGMFAIVLLDLRKNTLFLARDRFGIKPLYILQQHGRLAFSSELKSFKALPDFQFALNSAHLDEFLLFRNVINRTLFSDIVNLSPGEYWNYSLNGRIRKKISYYDVSQEGINNFTKGRHGPKLRDVLQQSVSRQLISDVKVGCQLSGGVDSSLVSYFAAQGLDTGQLETISIVFDNPKFSEESYVDYVAESLKLKAHKFTLNAGYYIDCLENASWHFESPLNHPNTIGIYLLSSEAKKYVTVLLSGEGADETMAGYTRFTQVDGHPFFSRFFLSQIKKNRYNLITFLKHHIDSNYRMILSSVTGSMDVILELKSTFDFNEATKERLLLARSLQDSGVNKHRKYEIKTYLPDLLMRQDKMSMAHSIENRVPFLDNEFVSAAFGLPPEKVLGVRHGKKETKILLKQLCADKFSEDFAFRPKMGFGIPLKEFMNSSNFQEKLEDQWLPGIKNRGIFNVRKIENWARNINGMSPDKLDGLWQMISFEIWAEQYLDA